MRLARKRLGVLAREQADVVSRTQIYALGVTRAEVRADLAARRWQAIGRHCVALHNGPVTVEARHWVAVLEAGPRAFIDGESSLVLAGLEHYTVDRIRVSVPRGARIRHRGTSLNIRQTRRWDASDLATGSGVPRSRNGVAAVRGALWARSDRQAALLMTMSVQQGLVSVEELAAELMRVRRHKRRAFLHGLMLDLAGGVRSLGELDLIHGCRERGIPEPDMQVLRRTSNGTYFLDFRWKRWRLVAEVDGIQHSWVVNLVADALRQNTIAIEGDTVLRMPVLGLRVCPDEFFGQIIKALQANGCEDVMRSGCGSHQNV
jgi:very-short-patch-repair endonuclease